MANYSFVKKSIIASYLILVFIFYAWTATSSFEKPFEFNFSKTLGKMHGGHRGTFPFDYYNALTDAFLAGKLHLLMPTAQDLKNDPTYWTTPYLPWDTCRYKDHYYLYHGPAPAVTLFMPFRLLSDGANLPQTMAVVLYSCGGLLFCIGLFRFLAKFYFREISFWKFFLFLLAISTGSGIPYLLRSPEFYQVAIASGYFFSAGSLFFFLTGSLKEKISLPRLLMGSLFLGLAVGSRLDLMAFALILPLVYYLVRARSKSGSQTPFLTAALAATGPFLLCLGIYGLYNYLRFGSWIEFGFRYRLYAFSTITVLKPDISSYYAGNLTNVPITFYWFLFQTPIWNLSFPFVHLTVSEPSGIPFRHMWTQGVGGVFPTIPITLTCLAFPFLLKHLSRMKHLIPVLCCFWLIAFDTIFIIGWALHVVQRYFVDFAWLFLIPSFVLWNSLKTPFIKNRYAKQPVNLILGLLVLYGWLVHIGISFAGSDDWLLHTNPDIYRAVSGFCYNFLDVLK